MTPTDQPFRTPREVIEQIAREARRPIPRSHVEAVQIPKDDRRRGRKRANDIIRDSARQRSEKAK